MTLLTLLESIDSTSLFSPEAIDRAKHTQYKARTKLILMRISKFLSLAAPLNNPEQSKLDNIKSLIDKGEKISDLPYLKTETEDGIAKVVGHEGRHRAIVLKELGYSYMPVIISDSRIRWSEQEDEDSYDYVKEFPTKIKAEKSSLRCAFPFTREEAPKDFDGKIGRD